MKVTIARGMQSLLGIATSESTEKRQRVDIERFSNSLNRLQRQVAFAALDTAHVGAVAAQNFSERPLAEAASFAVAAEVATESLTALTEVPQFCSSIFPTLGCSVA